MKNTFLISLLGLFSMLVVTSCHKDRVTTIVTIQNYTNSDLTISLNGQTRTLAYNTSASFSGSPGSLLNGTVTTPSGTTGVALSWSLSGYTFPPSGTEIIPIDVTSEYFYLTVKNNTNRSIVQVTTNSGSSDQKTDNISIPPNDGYTYGVGYYKAYSNTDVVFTESDQTTVQITNLGLPFSQDQFFAATIN